MSAAIEITIWAPEEYFMQTSYNAVAYNFELVAIRPLLMFSGMVSDFLTWTSKWNITKPVKGFLEVSDQLKMKSDFHF